jgi:quinol monooxygenase YgiN
MTGEPVTYEVNLVPDPAIEEAFDAWLDEHVAEMLRLPGFLTAVVRTSQDPDSGAPQRTVQYELADKAALDTYFKDHAQRMRQQGLERFADRFTATRRIMDRGHRISSAGPLKSCANCDSQLAGQYCAICGQRAKSRMITLWEMIREASDIIVSLDSKLWRTLGLLLFKPGRLTRDYLEGKRARFVAPLRLFLGLTLLFFFLVTIGQRMEIDGGFNVSADMEDGTAIGVLDPEADGGEHDSQDFSTRFGEADYAGGDQPDEDIDAPPITETDTEGDTETSAQDGPCDNIDLEVPEGWTMLSDFFTVDRVEQACQKVVADKGAGFSRALIENLPAMMFFFVPLLAVFMKIIYLFTGRFFVEHLLFLVHYHSFFYFVTTLAILTGWFVDWAELPDAPAQVLFAVISLYVFYYLYRAMRVVYEQGRLLTIVKYVSLNVFYFFSLMLTFVITVGITVFSL